MDCILSLNDFILHTSTLHILRSVHTQTREAGVVVRKLHHGLVSVRHVLQSSRSLTSYFVGTFDNFRDNLYISLTCSHVQFYLYLHD